MWVGAGAPRPLGGACPKAAGGRPLSAALASCASAQRLDSSLPRSLAAQSNERRGLAGKAEVRQALEFTLDRLGQDPAAGEVWLDYLAFLEVHSWC